MSNTKWQNLWKIILEKNNNVLDSWVHSNILNKCLTNERNFLKSCFKNFKINSANEKLIIDFSDKKYVQDKTILESYNFRKDIYDKSSEQNNSNSLMFDLSIALDQFTVKIFANNGYIKNIIIEKSILLKESIKDFFIGLKQYADLENNKIKNSVKNFKLPDKFNENEISNQMNKLQSQFLNVQRKKSSSIFEEEIKIFQTLYSLLDKIIWEYKVNKIPNNFIQILKKDYSTRIVVTEIFRKGTPFEFWIIDTYDGQTNKLKIKKEQSILKTKYANHPSLLTTMNFRNDLQHRLIPDNSNQSIIATHITLLIGIIMDLINSIENIT